jgi:hypothetical protein
MNFHQTNSGQQTLSSEEQVLKNSTHSTYFMKPIHLLTSSQQSTILPYPEPINPIYTPILFTTILILTFHLCLGLPSGLLPFDFPTYPLHAFLFCPTHLILFDFVNLITFRSEYTSLSTEAQVQFQVSPCGICDGEVAMRVFARVFRFSRQ